MSKHKNHILLVPGEAAWEIWASSADGGFTLHEATGHVRPIDLSGVPSGEVTMFFPVRAATIVPMHVTSDDESLFGDLATLHAERLGLKPDPMAGQLTDVFPLGKEGENTLLSTVFLRTPAEGDLPPRSPQSFDISPRAYATGHGTTLAIWQELGRWVFALYRDAKLLYAQATSDSSPEPSPTLTQEIRLAVTQLALQGISAHPSHAVVWSANPGLDVDALAALRVPLEIRPRPTPAIPSPPSKLLPADVRAARRAARKRRNITAAIAAAVVAYLGLIGYFAYGIWQKSDKTRRLKAKAEQIAPDAAAYADHLARWDELAEAIQLKNSPVDILHRISNCIPANSGLRLSTADIRASEITLRGEAPQFQPASAFSLKLTQNNDLVDFDWETPAPSQSKLGWDFTYKANSRTLNPQP